MKIKKFRVSPYKKNRNIFKRYREIENTDYEKLFTELGFNNCNNFYEYILEVVKDEYEMDYWKMYITDSFTWDEVSYNRYIQSATDFSYDEYSDGNWHIESRNSERDEEYEI